VIGTTLKRAAILILGFTAIIACMLLGFSLMFHIEFGLRLPDFGAPFQSIPWHKMINQPIGKCDKS
jgi:hypothetical protein